jgi:hypothetical protein
VSRDPYPTEDELTKVRVWPISSHADCVGLLEYVRGLWWATDWGWTESYGTEDYVRKYQISTGGWSGNEDLISALMDNQMFWALAWESTRRGGHYVFEIEREAPPPAEEER